MAITVWPVAMAFLWEFLYIYIFCCLKILCPPKAILKIKQKFYSLGTHKYLNYKKGLNFLYNFSPRNESLLF